MPKPNYPQSMRYTRTTLPLGPTHDRITTGMSFEAHLAIAYATALVQHFHALKVPLAALVRRAVIFYAAALGNMTPAARKLEAEAIKHAALGGCANEWQQQDAKARLEAMDAAEPVPFPEVFSGPDFSPPIDFAALEAGVDEVVSTLKPKTTKGTYAAK